jgi:hypothetical protein
MKGRIHRSDTWLHQPAAAKAQEPLANGEPSIHGPIADMHADYEAIVSQDPFAPDNLWRVLDSFDYTVYFSEQEPCPEQNRQSAS